MFFQSNTVRVVISLVFCFLISGVPSVYAVDADFGKLQGQAVAGDDNAQYELAGHYYKGDGVRKDYDAAFAWYKKAADQGHADAQCQMGHIYEYGVGIINKDKKQAFEWYLKSAKGGSEVSMTKVALMYMTGTGVERSKEKYKYWSNNLLESKGMVETAEEKAAVAKKEAAARRAAKARKAAAAKKAQRPAEVEILAKPVTKPVTKPAITQPATIKPAQISPAAKTTSPSTKPPVTAVPKRTPEQQKAWRREQARRLVEESNREAAEAGDWTDEE